MALKRLSLYPEISRPFFLMASYFVAGWGGLKLPFLGTHITLVWLPTGIAVAALVRWGRSLWPAIYLGALGVNLCIGSTWLLAAAIAVGNTAGPLVAADLLKRFGFHSTFDRRKDVALLVIAAAIGMSLPAFGGVTSLYLNGLVAIDGVSFAILSWWLGDTVGVLLAAPFLLTLTRDNLRHLSRARVELLCWMLLATTIAWFALVHDYGNNGQSLPLAFLTLPLLTWSGLRFGNTGAALAGLGFSLFAAWGTAMGQGGFILSDMRISLFLLWAYMATTVLTGLLITALQAERLKIEKELRLSTECLKDAQQIANIGSWRLDLVTNELSWSDEVFRLFEIDPRQFSANYEAFLNAVHPDDREAVYRAYNESLAQRTPYEITHRLLMRDGRIKWVCERCRTDYDASGKPLYSQGTVQDVTEQKQAEYQLRIAATVFESQEGMVVTDAFHKILKVNKAFTEMTGYSAKEVLGRHPRFLRSNRHGLDFYTSMRKTIHRMGMWKGEVWNRRKNGEVYPDYLTITAVKDPNGRVTHFVCTHLDITLHKAAAEEIERLAFYDPLTRLPNRRLLQNQLKTALAISHRHGRKGALLFIDLDHFKNLNDSLGHAMGDLLLQQVAERLMACVREGDTVARLGGDEFVVMIQNLSETPFEAAKQAEIIGHKIQASLNKPFQLGLHAYICTSSIGVTLFNGQHDRDVDELLKQADIAMYQAKTSGRNALRFFNPRMQDAINARFSLEDDLRKALDYRQFQLHYQLQVDNEGQVVGAEALLRWHHLERGMISPAEFIPLAEETGLILPIGRWVIEMACAQLQLWQNSPLTRGLELSINVSARQFFQADFVEEVRSAIRKHAINPRLLKLELTESLLIKNIEETVATMTALGKMGIHFSLDDFGTGYSSLQYLKQLPLNQLKIDQSFVRDIATNNDDQAIVRTIIAMASSLKLSVIAEGVETEEQRDFLLRSGCSHFQGYLFGQPLPITQFEAGLAGLKQIISG
jgi:diguanylate cyclase (GGDEF)-like protein/PAS domain S-box-containing protein